jgi:hypothetical protein
VPAQRPPVELGRLLTLQEVFRFVRESRSRMGVVFFGLLYLLGSLLGGGMLGLFQLHGGYTVEIVLGSGSGLGWWNYPGLLVIAPWGVLVLPFLSTLVMLVVAAGVGFGMTVAAILAYRLIRPSPGEAARSKAVGVTTGLTPAMIGLVTLGACCSTTTAATAGVGLIAIASGTTVASLLLNNWILSVFQLAIVWVALLAQELLLTIYGGWFRRPDSSPPAMVPPRVDGRYLGGLALRVGLIVGGLAWALAILAEWPRSSPLSAGPGLWFQWIVQHELLGVFAVIVGLFPGSVAATVDKAPKGVAKVLSGALLLGGLSLLIWLPAGLTRAGLDSLTDQILGALGVSAAWGGLPMTAGSGAAVVARWLLEYVLLAGFAVAFAVSPRRTAAPLLATLPTARGMPAAPGPDASPWAAGADEPSVSSGRRPDAE